MNYSSTNFGFCAFFSLAGFPVGEAEAQEMLHSKTVLEVNVLGSDNHLVAVAQLVQQRVEAPQRFLFLSKVKCDL